MTRLRENGFRTALNDERQCFPNLGLEIAETTRNVRFAANSRHLVTSLVRQTTRATATATPTGRDPKVSFDASRSSEWNRSDEPG